ncbi:MAG: 3-deoxy-D-manno-octulosonic acid transferase [Pseudomonadota bacterium]
MTALLRAYGAIARVALPFIARREAEKLNAAGMGHRLNEKLGQESGARGEGPLLWVHAASVGESLSALALVTRLTAHMRVLFTSGTATSAQLMQKRLPDGAEHRFAPLDAPGPVRAFLDHWRPDAALFIESELWPTALQELEKRGVPRALINARMSDKSLKRWQKAPSSARSLLKPFTLILTQSPALARAFAQLGAPRVAAAANLKSIAPALPVDPALVALVPKPCWVAASTHPGEEDIVLNAHAMLLERFPGLTLLLAPRHPERGGEIAALVGKRGWPVARRSQGAGPAGPVWLIDTLGELGSLYHASPIAFIGGSLTAVGGHNPYEAAHARAAIIAGPHVFNFADAYDDFYAKSAAQVVGNAQDLTEKVGNLLAHPPLLHMRREASYSLSATQAEGLEEIEAALIEALTL